MEEYKAFNMYFAHYHFHFPGEKWVGISLKMNQDFGFK